MCANSAGKLPRQLVDGSDQEHRDTEPQKKEAVATGMTAAFVSSNALNSSDSTNEQFLLHNKHFLS
jgi:hypothetical protein